MKIRKKFLSVIIIILALIPTGCSNQNELGNISVVTGLFLEKYQKDYLLIADCAVFQEEKQAVQIKQIRVVATSFGEAITLLQNESETPLSFSHVKVLLLGKNFPLATEIPLLEDVFHAKTLPADIAILQADFSEEELRLTNEKSFGLPIGRLLNKPHSHKKIKLYQLLKTPEKATEIPVVSFSENGLILSETT